MIGVSKTFGGSSILSSPALEKAGMLVKSGVPVFFVLPGKEQRIFGEILFGFSNVVCIEWIYIYGHVII